VERPSGRIPRQAIRSLSPWNNLARKFELLCGQVFHIGCYSRHITTGMGIALGKAKANGTCEHRDDDWNCARCYICRNGLNCCWRDEDIGIELHQFRRRLGKLPYALSADR
jgi:hypothetical protein